MSIRHRVFIPLFILLVIPLFLFSPSAAALSSFCSDGPMGEEPHTMYHLVTLDANDWAMGYLHVYSEVSGADTGFADEVGGIIGVPSGFHLVLDPIAGFYLLEGFSETGFWSNGPEPEVGFIPGGPWDECSHSAIFPAPSVTAFVIPPSGEVVQGEQVTLGFTASTDFGNICYFLGAPVGTSDSVTFAAQLSDAGVYRIDCANYFAANSDAVTLTVEPDPCPAPIPQIIREYNTFGVNLNPQCEYFTQSRASVYFSFGELNTGDFSWALIRDPLITVASSGIGLDKFREEFGASRIVNSAFRNPARNSSIGGAPQSRHMFGDAADIRNESGTQMEWDEMVFASQNANADFIEPIEGPCGLACVHLDWRSQAGDYQ